MRKLYTFFQKEYFLLEKNRERFCNAKATHVFSAKNFGVFEILTFEILTKYLLTTSLVLNTWALEFFPLQNKPKI